MLNVLLVQAMHAVRASITLSCIATNLFFFTEIPLSRKNRFTAVNGIVCGREVYNRELSKFAKAECNSSTYTTIKICLLASQPHTF